MDMEARLQVTANSGHGASMSEPSKKPVVQDEELQRIIERHLPKPEPWTILRVIEWLLAAVAIGYVLFIAGGYALLSFRPCC